MVDKGRPLRFKDANALSKSIDDYFNHREELEKPPTITGLALWLDCSIKTLQRYAESEDDDVKKSPFSLPIKKAYLRCFDYVYEGILTSKFPTGFIFAGKNFGLSDKQEHDVTTHSDVITVKLIDNAD